MSATRLVGIVLIVVGIVALALGGVSWTREKTVLDAGPLQIKTHQREGVALPPVLGAVALIGGIVLLVVPGRARA